MEKQQQLIITTTIESIQYNQDIVDELEALTFVTVLNIYIDNIMYLEITYNIVAAEKVGKILSRCEVKNKHTNK